MKIRLITIGTRMPTWVQTGYEEYARRMPRECALELVEINLPTRGKNPDIARLKEKEGDLILAKLSGQEQVVALDERGKPWSTIQLAGQLQNWRDDGRDVALIVGGPDGLSSRVKQRAAQQWALSPLVLPHPLVRIVTAEALYRAYTVNQGHPYHRA